MPHLFFSVSTLQRTPGFPRLWSTLRSVNGYQAAPASEGGNKEAQVTHTLVSVGPALHTSRHLNLSLVHKMPSKKLQSQETPRITLLHQSQESEHNLQPCLASPPPDICCSKPKFDRLPRLLLRIFHDLLIICKSSELALSCPLSIILDFKGDIQAFS